VLAQRDSGKQYDGGLALHGLDSGEIFRLADANYQKLKDSTPAIKPILGDF
jgi:hypothetical protein